MLKGRSHGQTDKTIINPEFSQRIKLDERALAQEKPSACTVRQDHWQKLTWGLLPFVLEVADRAAAAFLIKPHYPFFDKRLIEFCLALPAEQKIHHGWTRMIMRRAMEGILPKEIQWRKGKSNLGPNFNRGLLWFEKKRLDNVIFNDTRVISKYVNKAALQNAYNRYASGKGDEDAMTVWKTVTLALWLGRIDLGQDNENKKGG